MKSFQEIMSICDKAIKKYGIESQTNMIQEECAELIAAINQFKRGRITESELCSELADVDIMLNQARLIFNTKLWDEKKSEKIDRLESRINET